MKVALTINDFLRRAELVYGDRLAIIDEPDQPAPSWGTFSYRDMASRARSMAAALDQLGVPVGARVAMVSQNSARMLTSFYGVSGWGRIFVPINFRLSAAEVAYIVEDSGSDVLIIDPELEDALAGVAARHRFVIGSEADDVLFGNATEPRAWEADEDATATINYTSGTTARPKGVEQTHRSLWVNATTFGWQASVSDRDVYLHTLPQFHCNGWGMTYSVTGMGGTHVLLRKVDGREILRRIEAHGVTYLCGAPAVVSMILEAAASWEGPIPGSGRARIVVAGAPPPTRTIERVETELGWEFIQIYGLTETAPLLTMNRGRSEWDELTAAERATHLVRAGAPAIGVELDTSPDGEVLARSNVVLKSYWAQPEATSVALENGWFHTGDGGDIGDDSYLTISDRKKDIIITGGENVSSIEVEDVLFNHPGVAEVAVIGVPHEKWGETIKALIVRAPDSQVTEAELVEHCRSAMAHFKCPTTFEFRDELTRTATGKLQKFKLREPYWADRDRLIN